MTSSTRFLRPILSCVLLAGFTSAAVSAPTTATPPNVVFIGDEITFFWSSGFAANPNWINEGLPGFGLLGGQTSATVLARFQSDVVSLHPDVVHILVGANDAADAHDADWTLKVPGFLAALDEILAEAKAANIKVVLGTSPAALAINYSIMQQINAVIENYGAAHEITVINYGDALCDCVGSTSSPAAAGSIGNDFTTGNALIVQTAEPWPVNSGLLPSTIGYDLMTQMAQATLNTMNVTLKSGWLQNVEQANYNEDGGVPIPNVTNVSPSAVIQFTPYGVYNDGSQQPLQNTNAEGSSGAWTSSNSLVMSVNQQGLAFALSPGTATIRYVSPGRVKFSPWVMYVGQP